MKSVIVVLASITLTMVMSFATVLDEKRMGISVCAARSMKKLHLRKRPILTVCHTNARTDPSFPKGIWSGC